MAAPPDDLAGLSPLKRALLAIRELKRKLSRLEVDRGAPIAVIGIGARFPGGARGADGLWGALEAGVDTTSEVPASRWDATSWARDGLGPSRGSFLEDIEQFDAGFFGIAPREAAEMDPAQRALLEVAWEALEDGSVPVLGLSGTRTAVYVGLGLSDYGRRHFLGSDPARLTPWSGTGTLLSVAAGRIAYTLGLVGPALTVDTACSSSLVAVHLAVQALRAGEADLALAGGANVMLSPMPTAYFARLQALSSDGRCRAFDAAADGYGRGEGVGVVALKRFADALADGDPIRAVIRGSAVNHDGRSNGLTAPSGTAQQAVIRAALADAGLTPDAIGAVEAHGTGTPLGDPIEMDALRAVFGGHARLRIGSVKTNFAHTETAAGVAGLIKATLAIQRGALPRHNHLAALNPRVRLDDVGFEIVREHTPWPADLPRRFGVSAFGLSGTNAHVVLEPAPERAVPEAPAPPHLIALSARTDAALAQLAEQTAARLVPDALAGIAQTSCFGRSPLPRRLAVAARDVEQAARALRDAIPREAEGGKVAWLFTGQGSQWPGMAASLYAADPVFRDTVDRVATAVDLPLIEVLLADDPRVHRTEFTQPAIYAVQCGLAARFSEAGPGPAALIGHSVGEFAAAWFAGVFSLEDGARLVAARGRLIGALPAGGGMVAVLAPPDRLPPLPRGVEIAAINHPGQVVLSGDADALDATALALDRDGIDTRRLDVSHAFHSARMDPALEPFRQILHGATLREPRGRLTSAVDGLLVGRRALDPEYWVRQLREPVRFSDALLAVADCSIFLELGPQAALCQAGARTIPEARFIPTLSRGGDGPREVLQAIGELWAAGVAVQPPRRQAPDASLPTMPWQGERHWIDPEAPASADRPEAVHRLAWVDAPPPQGGPPPTGLWWVLAHGPSDVELALVARGARVLRIGPGASADDGDVHVDPSDAEGFRALLDRGRPTGVLVLWGLSGPVRGREALLGVVNAANASGAPVSAVLAIDRPSGLPGLMRAIRSESPERVGSIVHVGDDVDPERVLAELAAGTPEVRLTEARAVPRLRPTALPEPPPLGRIVWITGGSGDLGLQLARRLAKDVDALVLISRRGIDEHELIRLGPHVRSVRGDVTDNLVPLAAEVPPDVIFHLAGERVDGLAATIDADALERAFHARVDGAWRLNEVAPDAELVLVGSAAAMLGNAGQGAYAAANAWLEGFARWRTAQGAPTWCLAPGPIAGTGMAEDVLARLATRGARALSIREALDLVLAVRGSREPALLAAPFDWARWREANPSDLLAELAPGAAPSAPTLTDPAQAVDRALCAVLGTDVPPPPDTGFFDAGLDSLMATELRARLQVSLGRPLPPTLAFDHPTRARLTAFLAGEVVSGPAAAPLPADVPIAIVGVACRLPGGIEGIDALWALLASDRDAIRPIDRWDLARHHAPEPAPGRHVNRAAGLLDDLAGFDAALFGISPREAARIDPQQRLLLEAAWDALEHAGRPPGVAEGPVGVWVGIGKSEYARRFDPLDPGAEPDPYSGTGNESSFAAGRIAHALGLDGPALAVDTACSSSLVALHLAVRSLRSGECRTAIVGGVSAIVGPESSAQLTQLRALAPDGRCKTFDAAADGYGRGEGVVALVLQRLDQAEADGARVLAVVRGTAVNHDGRSAGLTVPNGSAQRAVIAAALADAGVRGDEIDLLEAHGTGTRLGDPIEIEAARAALLPGRPIDRPLIVSAVKPRLGHLEAGAGLAGLLQAALALAHGAVPAHRQLHTPNPDLDLDGLVLPRALHAWRGRYAGVSSFGLSGTNAHVVIERGQRLDPVAQPRPRQLLVATGVDAEAIAIGLTEPDDLPGPVARGIGEGRAELPLRGYRVLPGGQPSEAAPTVDGARAWLFTGQGAQWVGMGLDLLDREPVFGDALHEAASVLADDGIDLFAVLGDERVHHTRFTQPATFAVEWALACWLRSRGHEPDLVMGHSLGEWTAAAVAGALDWRDALRLVARRGELMGSLPEGGATAAVFCGPERARAAIGSLPLDIAGLNGPHETVISGDADALDALLERIGVEHKRLRVSHAFHSRRMEPAVEPFLEAVRGVRLTAARIPLVTNADGALAGDRVTDPAHWAGLIRAPVHFDAGLRTLAAHGVGLLVELGPHPVLLGMARRTLDVRAVPTLLRDRPGVDALYDAIGRLWQAGDAPDWEALSGASAAAAPPPRRFHRVRHWIERREPAALPTPVRAAWRPVDAPVTAPAPARVEGDGPLAAALREQLPVGGPALWAGGPDGVLDSARRALADGSDWGAIDAGDGAVAGFARSFAREHPARSAGLVVAAPGVSADAIARAWSTRGAEPEIGALPERAVRRLTRFDPEPPPVVRGTWLVTGASGSIGRAVVERLLAAGAAEIVALSRSGAAPDDPRVRSLALDLADPACETALAGLALSGIAHCAGVGRRVALAEESDAGWREVFAAKVDGARRLDRLFPTLDAFLVSSSVAATWGSAEQTTYAAANAALEQIVEARRARGQDARAVALGPVRGGLLDAESEAWLAARGLRAISPAQAAEALLRVHGVCAEVDWSRLDGVLGGDPRLVDLLPARPAAVHGARGDLPALVRAAVGAVLGRPPKELDAEQGLFDAGLDSLTAVELAAALGRALDQPIPPTLAFEHGTIAAITAFLAGDEAEPEPAPTAHDGPIAIVGMACRFPGGVDSPEAYWELLAAGRDAVGPIPAARWDASRWSEAPAQAALLDEVDAFDPLFFGISPREAAALDPQQRLLLEVAHEAVERAGVAGPTLRGAAVGVFCGIPESSYLDRFERPDGLRYPDEYAGTGNESSFAAGRVAWALGLHGPAVSLNTACSSSLVAMHLACESLRAGDCDLALAGGVSLMLSPDNHVYLARLGALAADGRCRTFDAGAGGYGRGEGAGFLVLATVAEAERRGLPILAVIEGSAVNHDGGGAGLTVPNGIAQERVIRAALARAGATGEQIGYLEAHGTGTRLGDPIEVRAARRALGDAPRWIGAVKTQIGHLEQAAGVASVIKVVLQLQHGQIAPHLHLATPNPDLELGPMRVPTSLTAWEGPRRAGISGFGLSGTNAHLIVGPGRDPAPPARDGSRALFLSATSVAALDAYAVRLAPALDAWGAPAVAGALVRRAARPHRRVLLDGRALASGVARRAPELALCFTGQGAQRPGMADALREDPVFADAFDAVVEIADRFRTRPLRPALATDAVHATENAQIALFAFEWALACWWRAQGVEADRVAGHSVGELVAATWAGMLPLEAGVELVCARGRLMGALPAGGAMAAVFAGEAVVRDALAPGAEVAGVNHDEETVISGGPDAIAATLAALPAGVAHRALTVSHAFHSAAMEPMLDALTEVAERLPWSDARVPLARGLDAVVSRQPPDPGYWARQVRGAVRFADAVRALRDAGTTTWLEIGPAAVLTGAVARLVPSATAVSSLRKGGADDLIAAVAALWVDGVACAPTGFAEPRGALVPPTPFARERCWLDLRPARAQHALDDDLLALTWPTRPVGADRGPAEVIELPCPADVPALERALADLLATCRRLLASRGRAVFVTSGVPLLDEDAPTGALGAALHGFLRAAAAEARGWSVVDRSPEIPLADAVRAAADGEPWIALRPSGRHVARLARAPLPAGSFTARADRAYVVTGGFGGLGLEVAAWLAERGAGEILLLSRTAREPALERLRALGCASHGAAIDVADPDAIDAALARLERPLAGVVHAAGVLDDGAIDTLTPERVKAPSHPKIRGALALREAVRGADLEFFVLFSSASAVLGSAGQAGYAAANAGMDALARTWRAEGLPVVSIGWGPWAEVGMAAALPERIRAAQRDLGVRPLSVARGLAALERLLAASPGHRLVLSMDWSAYGRAAPDALAEALTGSAPAPEPDAPAGLPDDLEAWVEGVVRRTLRLPDTAPVDRVQPLLELGMDSLMAVQVRNAIAEAGVDLPMARLLGGPSVEAIASLIAAARDASDVRPAPVEPDGDLWFSPVVTHALVALLALILGAVLTWSAIGVLAPPAPPAPHDVPPPRALQ